MGDDLRIPDVVVHRWPLQHPTPDEGNPLGPADVGLVVEVVSPRTRKTDRFMTPGEYAAAGIALYWRLETAPELVLHTYVLHEGAYRAAKVVTGIRHVAAPWGEVVVDLGPLRPHAGRSDT